MESYAEASASNRINMEELRHLAALDQRHARAEDRWFLAVQDWTMAANALFDIQLQYKEALNNYWYRTDAPYEPGWEEKLIEGYRLLVEESEQLLGDIAILRAKGRPIVGAESYESHVLQAREILEDDEIRRQAERLMPGLDKLDALADAQRRSAGL